MVYDVAGTGSGAFAVCGTGMRVLEGFTGLGGAMDTSVARGGCGGRVVRGILVSGRGVVGASMSGGGVMRRVAGCFVGVRRG